MLKLLHYFIQFY